MSDAQALDADLLRAFPLPACPRKATRRIAGARW